MRWRGILQFVTGLIQAVGALLYLVLLTVDGFQPFKPLVGGVLVAVTLFGFAVFGLTGRGKL